MSKSGGRILCEQAYAQGKMLESHEWQGKLPRGITPSDVDLFFGNRGKLLICEFSRNHAEWRYLEKGQRDGYKEFVQRGMIAALCKHSVPKDCAINTYRDVESFSVMYATRDLRVIYLPPEPGTAWVPFVTRWYADSDKALASMIFRT